MPNAVVPVVVPERLKPVGIAMGTAPLM